MNHRSFKSPRLRSQASYHPRLVVPGGDKVLFIIKSCPAAANEHKIKHLWAYKSKPDNQSRDD